MNEETKPTAPGGEGSNQEQSDARQRIIDLGSAISRSPRGNIFTLTIIGQVEGHQILPDTAKSTKYEHVMPLLASLEQDTDIDGVLLLLNTVGGDIEAGLGIAELVAGMRKPTVSLVLGGGHSIGVPLAVAPKVSMIVPSASMTIHPVRMNGTVIGVPQTFDYFKQIQDRITGFVCSHCGIDKKRLEELMMETGMLTKDVGTILVGDEAVKMGIINEVGGIDKAVSKLHEMMREKTEERPKIQIKG